MHKIGKDMIDIVEDVPEPGHKESLEDIEAKDTLIVQPVAATQNQSAKKAEKTEDSPTQKGLSRKAKIAKAFTTMGAFALTIVDTVFQTLQGDLTKGLNLVKEGFNLVFSASNISRPLKNLQQKVTEKLKSNKIGRAIVNGISTIWHTLTSKPAKRIYKVGMAVLSLVSVPTPLGIALATISLAAVTYNVVKECLEIRTTRKLELEKKLLEQHQQSRIQQQNLINSKQLSPVINNFLAKYQESFDKVQDLAKPIKKSSTVKEIAKVLGSNILEGIATIGESLEGDLIEQTAAAVSVLGNVSGEVKENLTNKQKHNLLIKDINQLKTVTASYENLDELKETVRQQAIRTETLAELLQEQDITTLNEEQLDQRFSAISEKIARKPEFTKPLKKTFLQKFTSAIKSGWSYFKQSQFGSFFSKSDSQKETPIIQEERTILKPKTMAKDHQQDKTIILEHQAKILLMPTQIKNLDNTAPNKELPHNHSHTHDSGNQR